jgi:nucleoside-diphosphate-sugar epimerase
MMNKVTIFGHGYVSSFLIKTFSRLGWNIVCTSRKIDIARPIKYENLTLINFFDPDLLSILQTSNIILSTVPPEQNIDPVLRQYRNIIAQEKSLTLWIGYLSSTNVYGNHQGAWVDETMPCNPSNQKARDRLEIEKQWLNLYDSFNLPVHVFRLSGIYGPGRNCLEDILLGKDFTIVKENHYFSRIHIEDICQLILNSINYPTPGEIYNISDNEPMPLHVVQQFGAKILGKDKLKEIMEEKAKISESFKRFFMDNKKVNGQKIIKQLGVNLIYPDYLSGLLHGCLPFFKKFIL